MFHLVPVENVAGFAGLATFAVDAAFSDLAAIVLPAAAKLSASFLQKQTLVLNPETIIGNISV